MEIRYATEAAVESYVLALGRVAAEQIYIERVHAPPVETVAGWVREMISRDDPAYFALEGGRVVGWADVTPIANPRMAHRGVLGMGLLPEYRGRGLGSRLLETTLAHAARRGLEKVELCVYASNAAAIALYEKFGFTREGLIVKYRKVEGRYFDAVQMSLFLSPPR